MNFLGGIACLLILIATTREYVGSVGLPQMSLSTSSFESGSDARFSGPAEQIQTVKPVTGTIDTRIEDPGGEIQTVEPFTVTGDTAYPSPATKFDTAPTGDSSEIANILGNLITKDPIVTTKFPSQLEGIQTIGSEERATDSKFSDIPKDILTIPPDERLTGTTGNLGLLLGSVSPKSEEEEEGFGGPLISENKTASPIDNMFQSPAETIRTIPPYEREKDTKHSNIPVSMATVVHFTGTLPSEDTPAPTTKKPLAGTLPSEDTPAPTTKNPLAGTPPPGNKKSPTTKKPLAGTPPPDNKKAPTTKKPLDTKPAPKNIPTKAAPLKTTPFGPKSNPNGGGLVQITTDGSIAARKSSGTRVTLSWILLALTVYLNLRRCIPL